MAQSRAVGGFFAVCFRFKLQQLRHGPRPSAMAEGISARSSAILTAAVLDWGMCLLCLVLKSCSTDPRTPWPDQRPFPRSFQHFVGASVQRTGSSTGATRSNPSLYSLHNVVRPCHIIRFSTCRTHIPRHGWRCSGDGISSSNRRDLLCGRAR